MDTTDDEQMEPGYWRKSGWIARVMKNEEDEGWAVEMTRIGDDEPALVGPWTMGRDKKNPKPMDAPSFATLVKTASEVLLRHEQAARERLHKSLVFQSDGGLRIRLDLDLVEDDEDPHAILTAHDDITGELLRRAQVAPGYKLSAARGEQFLAETDGEE